MRRRKAGHFFKLGGKMCHTAVMQLVGDFGEGELIVYQQFFYPLDLVRDNELLDRNALHF